eukprot:symbB.v1.2.021598.t1/scaffold1875.1/size97484/3
MDRAVIDVLASLELDVFQQSLEQLGVHSCMDVLYVTHLMDEDLIQIGLNLVQIRKLQFNILRTLRKNDAVPVHDAEAVPVHAEGRLGLGRLSLEEVKQMIGEQLFPKVSKIEPDNAAKITGMMLEMGNKELLILLDSEQQLQMMVDDALRCALVAVSNSIILHLKRRLGLFTSVVWYQAANLITGIFSPSKGN